MLKTQKPELINTSMEELCAMILDHGLEDGLPEMFATILNQAMTIERAQTIKALPYQRNDERLAHSNGFKPKNLKTRVGIVPVSIPQVRGMTFYPKTLERGQRSEKALKAALAQMYIQGVSTRKVTKIVEQLCGFHVTSSQVSNVCKELDVQLEAFRNRPISSMPYVFVDARYEKVRYQGHVRDLAVLWAMGINKQGKKEVLGVKVSLSEAEVHWREFFQNLVTRGLKDVELIVSDDHAGLKAARKSILGSVPWQRCQFHLAKNAQSYALNQNQKSDIADDIRDIFNAPDSQQALKRVKEKVQKYEKSNSVFATWLDQNIIEGLSVFAFPKEHRKKIRTTNLVERINREIKTRTRVASLFPNSDSCLRLVSAILLETHEQWITGRTYLDMNLLIHHNTTKEVPTQSTTDFVKT